MADATTHNPMAPHPDGDAPSADAMARLLDRPIRTEDLVEQTQRVATPVEEDRDRGASVLVFTIGAERFALPTTDIARTVPAVRPHRIPHRSNNIVRGLGNIDGELVLCASLRSLLGLARGSNERGAAGERANSHDRQMIVVGDSNGRWALTVDRVLGIEYVTEDDRRAPPMTVERALQRYTESVFDLHSETVALLDATRIISGFEAALT
jgi:chemotaxis-related protein WspD